MRKINYLLCLIIGVLFSASALAQQINKAEYFFDTDPGVGHGIAITVSPAADSVDISGSINTTGLPAGFHTLCIRARNDSARWSLYEARKFYINAPNNSASLQITGAEYFFDNDPGVGNGTAVATGAAADSIDVNSSVNTTGLTAGFHTLVVRVKNSGGIWSLYEARKFYINAPNNSAALQITGAEYFFDNDPGIGNGTAITTGAAADSIDVTSSASTTALPAGFHTLVVRVKNSGGIWSLYEARRFYLDVPASTSSSQIVNAESFFDADPGQGNGIAVTPTFAAADSVDLTRSIGTTGLALGTHYLYTRVQDQQGNWSLAVGDTFQIIQVGIDEISNNFGAFLYPNPMTAYTILQFDTRLSDAEVVIYDMLGKEMMRTKLTGDRMVIKRGSLVSGVYFVRVADEDVPSSGTGVQWTGKMVVQ